jgi:hypothetical protein
MVLGPAECPLYRLASGKHCGTPPTVIISIQFLHNDRADTSLKYHVCQMGLEAVLILITCTTLCACGSTTKSPAMAIHGGRSSYGRAELPCFFNYSPITELLP